MSLKALHLVFITASLALCIGFGVWGFAQYQESRSSVDLAYGVGSVIGVAALIAYGWYFLKKLKHMSYL